MSEKPGVSTKLTVWPSILVSITWMSRVPAYKKDHGQPQQQQKLGWWWVLSEHCIHDVRLWPISRSDRPVTLEMKVVFPAPVMLICR